MLPNTYDHFIREACRAFLPEGFDWRWLKAAFWQESRFKPLAVSPVGACVDLETEILTTQGWKGREEITIGDGIYSWNSNNGLLEHDTILDLVDKISDENYKIYGRHFDSLSSHDHRWYLQKRDYNAMPPKIRGVTKTTEEITSLKSSSRFFLPHPSKSMVDFRKEYASPYSLEILQLVGLIVGDGTINKARGRVELVCHDSAKREMLLAEESIRAVFPEGVSEDYKKSKGALRRWLFTKPQSQKLLEFFDTQWNSTNQGTRFIKRLNREIFGKLCPKGASALLTGYLLSDGNLSQDGVVSFRNTEPEVINDFCHLAVISGENPRACWESRAGTHVRFPCGRISPQKDICTVYLRKHSFTSMSHNQIKIEKVCSPLQVWCPTTRNGTWVARRSGCVYITGNCGVAQIMPATWEQWAPRALESTGIPNNPFNAEASILVGTRYFAWIYNEWSWPRPEIDRLCLASASYNSGLGDLLKAQDIMGGKSLYAQIVAGLDEVDPKGVDETVEYVKMILRWYSEIVTEG